MIIFCSQIFDVWFNFLLQKCIVSSLLSALITKSILFQYWKVEDTWDYRHKSLST